jgi:hypothetical protein
MTPNGSGRHERGVAEVMEPYARHADASLQSVEGLRQQLRMVPRAAQIASRLRSSPTAGSAPPR